MNNVNKYAILGWFSASLYFFYQYLLRVYPNIMIADLRIDFSMDAHEFSLLGAVYLYSYALMQIPMGFILDKYGIQKTISIAIFICVVSTFMAAFAPNSFILIFSRFLMGASSACALISALKITSDNFSSGAKGFLIGAALSIGTIGALISGKMSNKLLEVFNWRETLIIYGICGFLILMFCYLTTENINIRKNKADKFSMDNVLQVFKNKNIIIYAILAIGLYVPISVLADLWATDFLMKKYNLPRDSASTISVVVYLGLSIGSLTVPYIAEKYKIIDSTINISLIAILLIFSYIIFGPVLSFTSIAILLILLGFFCSAEMVCFAAASDYSNSENSGVTMGIVNTSNMLGAGIAQQIVGFALDCNWDNQYEKGIKFYSADNYSYALSTILIFVVVCLILSLGKKYICKKW